MKREDWEPTTEEEWLAFFKLLAEISAGMKTETTMTDAEVAIALKIYNMLKFLLDVGNLATQASGEVVGYKDDLLNGDPTTSMVLVPAPADYPTAPAVTPAGAKKWGRALRKRLMPFCTDGTASSLHFIKGEVHFVQANYTPPIDGSTTIGNIHVETSVKNCGLHALYARITGTEFWIFVRTFEGASYDYHRIPTVPNKPESVDLMLMGVFHNVEDGHPSATFTILYQPQQTPPPAPVV